MQLRVLLLLSCLLALRLCAQPATNAATTSDGSEAELVFSNDTFWGTVHYPAMNLDFAVRKDPGAEFFYLQPVLIPDWSSLRQELHRQGVLNAEGSPVPGGDDQPITVPFAIAFRDDTIDAFVLDAINAERREQNLPVVASKRLSVLPFSRYEIWVDLAGQPVLLRSQAAETSGSPLVHTNLPRSVTLPLTGTRRQLAQFYADRLYEATVSGHLFVRGRKLDTAKVKGAITGTFRERVQNDLNGTETLKTTSSARSSGGGGGFALNLPGLRFGGGSTNATTHGLSETKRVVNRAMVNDILERNAQHLQLDYVGDSSGLQLLDLVAKQLLDQAQGTELRFERTTTGQWNLGNDQIGYATLLPQEEKILLAARPEIDQSADDSTTATGKGQSTSSTRKFAQKISDDIKWEKSGNTPVPTSVKMKIIDLADLSNDFELVISRFLTSGLTTQIVPFLNPATALYDADVARPHLLDQFTTLTQQVARLDQLAAASGQSSALNLGENTWTPATAGTLIVSASAEGNGGGDHRSFLRLTIKVNGQEIGAAQTYVPSDKSHSHRVNASGMIRVEALKPLKIELALQKGAIALGTIKATGVAVLLPAK